MTHKAILLQDSIEAVGPDGIAFTTRCCGDPKTDKRHTIHQAGKFKQHIKSKIQTLLDDHADEHHHGQSAKELIEQLAGSASGECKDCG